jgi:Flp pilus assembly protein TadD
MTARTKVRALALAALSLAGCATSQATSAHQVQLGMAAQFAAAGDWGSSFAAADVVVRERPDDVGALLLRARALRHQGMLAEAEADLRRAAALAPRSPPVQSELGLVCEYTARPGEALEHHRTAHELAPADPRFANNLAFALLVRGKGREAVPLLEGALRVEPGSERLRNNLGFALASAGDFRGADRQFRMAGTPAQAAANLGFAYERAGNLTQAYDQYLRALRMDPAADRPRANLEHVARALGRDVPADLPPAEAPATEKGGS